MRKASIAAVLVLAAGVGVGACEGASKAQGGNPDEQGAQQYPEAGQGTAANDTTPHRPGAPGAENAGPAGPGAGGDSAGTRTGEPSQ